jgi:hypothetical protein
MTVLKNRENAIIAFIYAGIMNIPVVDAKRRLGLANRRIRPLCHLSSGHVRLV